MELNISDEWLLKIADAEDQCESVACGNPNPPWNPQDRMKAILDAVWEHSFKKDDIEKFNREHNQSPFGTLIMASGCPVGFLYAYSRPLTMSG